MTNYPKTKDGGLVILGLFLILLALFLVVQSCVTKIPCDKVNLKDISLCASVKYQDKIAELCVENDSLKNENSQLLNKIDILEEEITRLQNGLISCNQNSKLYFQKIAQLERIKKGLEEKMDRMAIRLEGQKKALERTNREIEKLEKNK